MMKYFFAFALAGMMAFSFNSHAQDALYSKSQFEKILQQYDEIVVVMPGYDRSYDGVWLNTMEIVGDYTLTFSRGRVVHSFDLRTCMFVQEEGRYVKLWLR
jgi:hypothetical protein